MKIKCSYMCPATGDGCQIANFFDPIIQFEGSAYCDAHLPLAAKANWNSHRIGELQAKLAAYTNQQFELFDLRGIQLPAGVDQYVFQPRRPFQNRTLVLDDALIAGPFSVLNSTGSDLGLQLRRTRFFQSVHLSGKFKDVLAVGAQFENPEGTLSLSEVNSETLDLSGATISSRFLIEKGKFADFLARRTRFDGDVSVSESSVEGALLDFAGSRFQRTAHINVALRGAERARFTAATFNGSANRLEIRGRLRGPLALSRSTFNGLHLATATSSPVHARRVTVTGRLTTDFKDSPLIDLHRIAAGSDAHSNIELIFNGVDLVNLSRCTMRSPIALSGGVNNLDSSLTQYERSANFSELRVKTEAKFDKVVFRGLADFSVSPIGPPDGRGRQGRLLFICTQFGDEATFARRKFLGEVTFSGSVFALAPDFAHSELHPTTRFPESTSSFLDVESEWAAERYRQLRQHCEELRARPQEGLFFLLEQRSARREMSRAHRFASLIYDFFGRCGTSYVVPLFWLGILWLAGTCFYALHIAKLICFEACRLDLSFMGRHSDWSIIGEAAHFSLLQTVAPFYVLRNATLADGWSIDRDFLVGAIAFVQSLASIGMLSFILIALRWRFHRG